MLTTGAEIHDTNQFVRWYTGTTLQPDREETPQDIAARRDAFEKTERELEQHVAMLRSRRARSGVRVVA
jgi:hypothetical protein